MHEVGMMQDVLHSAIESAHKAGATQIRLVQMRVGTASGVEPESLDLAFDVAKQGTIAADAQLQIDRVPTICYCSHCDREFTPVDVLNECPQCHQISVDVRQGKEFELAFVEVS